MHMSLRGVALFTFTMDVLYVVFMGSELQGLLFICVTKQPEADSFKCSHSNCEYCLAALTVVSWYCVLEMWYLWYRCSK